MSPIVVIDYGMGNLRSVSKALERVGADVVVTQDPARLADAAGVVLPGVGAFRAAMENLERAGFVDPIQRYLSDDRPFLGICLGLQLLFERSEEFGDAHGLGVLPGTVRAFPPPARGTSDQVAKVPHMGWNQLRFAQPSPLFDGIPDGAWTYFVHSFYGAPSDASVETARTDHGLTFTAAVGRGNLAACQFHPEKSQAVGLKMLENFKRMCQP